MGSLLHHILIAVITKSTCYQRVQWSGKAWERRSHTFFGVGMRSHTFLHKITLKYGCDLTDVLATRRFALLVKSLQ